MFVHCSYTLIYTFFFKNIYVTALYILYVIEMYSVINDIINILIINHKTNVTSYSSYKLLMFNDENDVA